MLDYSRVFLFVLMKTTPCLDNLWNCCLMLFDMFGLRFCYALPNIPLHSISRSCHVPFRVRLVFLGLKMMVCNLFQRCLRRTFITNPDKWLILHPRDPGSPFLRMVMEPKYNEEEVIVHPNHSLTKVVVSNIFYFRPTWGDDPLWLIFFKWIETTN